MKVRQWIILGVFAAVFAACYFLPVGWARFDNAVNQSLLLVRDYARQHVLLCLVPALFIAGAIGAFVSQASVMKYLGAKANKLLAYSVASVSGSVLSVCSCTVLPLFAGIYRMGAGLGPATAFLYAGPAINVLAILLTARVLGAELGAARAIGAVAFSVVIGLAMALIFRRDSRAREALQANVATAPAPSRALWKTGVYFAVMVGVLVFANWSIAGEFRGAIRCCPTGDVTSYIEGTIVSRTEESVTIVDSVGVRREVPSELVAAVEPLEPTGAYGAIHRLRYIITAVLVVALVAILIFWFRRRELVEWVESTWSLAKLILPLLLAGVLVAGLLLGRPGAEGLIPSRWVQAAVGGNSVRANVLASVAGALMYFATLTEVPIVYALLGAGMGKGPALALLLAGPALSLPNMLVIASVLGARKTVVFVSLVVVMATTSGMIYGAWF